MTDVDYVMTPLSILTGPSTSVRLTVRLASSTNKLQQLNKLGVISNTHMSSKRSTAQPPLMHFVSLLTTTFSFSKIYRLS